MSIENLTCFGVLGDGLESVFSSGSVRIELSCSLMPFISLYFNFLNDIFPFDHYACENEILDYKNVQF